jgi:SnoaL-like domain
MTFAMQRSGHSDLTPQEIADRLASVYMDSRNPVPTQEIRGRGRLRPVFENLSAYEATTHLNGQSTVTWEQDAATGVSYCLAYHLRLTAQVEA